MSLRATEVFTPGSFPKHTYVERDEQQLEHWLRDALQTQGVMVSIAGPSKSGKTVLVERVVGDLLIPITGAGVATPDDVWKRVFDWMDVPDETASGATTGGSVEAGAEARGKASLPFVASGEAGGSASASVSHSRERVAIRRRGGLAQAIRELADSDFVVLVDDFHYMQRDAQTEVAYELKEAARQGVRVVTASVPHRSDDVVRALPELRGRVLTVDTSYWELEHLMRIGELGFEALNGEIGGAVLRDFAKESAGSPQLMQAICLHACFETDLRTRSLQPSRVKMTRPTKRAIFKRTAPSTNFRSLVQVLAGGPRTRGQERREYGFDGGGRGDVYNCILRAIAADPPQLSFSYDEVRRRIGEICEDEVPVGSSVIRSCAHMCKLAQQRFPNERPVLDWDEDRFELDIPDPYLLFYLRWSDHLE